MSLLLLEHDDAHGRLQTYVDSGAWWIVPQITSEALDVIRAIENRYYTGEANADFELLLGPLPPFGQLATAMFHKRRISPQQLAAVLVEHGSPDMAEQLAAGLDVLIIAPDRRGPRP